MTEDLSAHRLLTQLKCGHVEMVDILYLRYSKDFYMYARNEGLTHEDAEDVVHTTFYRILSRIGSYDENYHNGQGWMRTICINAVIDLLRRKSTEQLPDDCPSPEDTDPERSFERNERLQNLNAAWQRIAEEDRQEIRRGRGRGPGRRAWHKAISRLRDMLDSLEGL